LSPHLIFPVTQVPLAGGDELVAMSMRFEHVYEDGTGKVDHEPFAAQICIVEADAQAKVPGVHEPDGAGDCDGAVTEVLEDVVDGAAATLVVDVAAVELGAVGETDPSPEILSMTFWL